MDLHIDRNIAVIDNGSCTIKAGYGGADDPESQFPSIVGRPTIAEAWHGRDCFVGGDALERRGILDLKPPVEQGRIVNWDDMGKLWHHTFFTELRVDPEQASVLMTESPQTTKKDREKMTEIVFETLKCKRFYVNVQAVLALYASGRTTGIVLDCGEGKTHAVPIFEGFPLPHAVLKSNLAGKDLTTYMKRLLVENGYKFETSTEQDQIATIKEKLDFVALDFEEEMTNSTKTAKEERYTMPDGSVIRVGNPSFRCPEALFKPAHLGWQEEVDGLHEVVFKSVNKCDSDIMFDLFSNIVLAGGTTLFRNFPARLEKEVGNLTPSAIKPRVIAPPERRRSVWIGGSLLVSLPSFEKSGLWITQADYNEEGAGVAFHRCFG